MSGINKFLDGPQELLHCYSDTPANVEIVLPNLPNKISGLNMMAGPSSVEFRFSFSISTGHRPVGYWLAISTPVYSLLHQDVYLLMVYIGVCHQGTPKCLRESVLTS